MPDATKDFIIPATNKNVEQARTQSPDPAVTTSPLMNADDPERDRKVIRQGDLKEDVAEDPTRRMTPEERAKRKAFLVQAFDRGIVHDRLHVQLPPHLHGEWVRNDPLEVDRLKTLGFDVDLEYASRRGLHSDGTGASIVADVIFMTCPKELKEIIDEIRMDKFMAVNGKPGDRKAKTKEEREFEANTARDSGNIVPTVIESQTESRFSKADVEAALERVDKQTQVQAVPTPA